MSWAQRADWAAQTPWDGIQGKPPFAEGPNGSITMADVQGLLAALAGKLDRGGLAKVATTGNYHDLLNKPALGSAAFASVDDFLTAADLELIGTFTAENKDVVTINPGMAVAAHPSGTGVILAVNTMPARACAGLSQSTTAPTFADVFRVDETLTLTDWTDATGSPTLSPLGIYFLDSTPGMITLTAPTALGSIVQIVGQALSPDTLKIELQPPILL